MKDFEVRLAKNILKGCDKYCTYYNSKKRELRVAVAVWDDNQTRPVERENERILKILAAFTENGLRPKYRREQKRFQGFINYSYIVFE